MKRALIILFLLQISLISCERLGYHSEGGELVVEGWIGSGAFPVVMVSKTIPAMEDEIPVSDLSKKYVEYLSKVTLSDGNREVILVGLNDGRYVPSYIYSTSEMRGETGKTYLLNVRTKDGKSASCKTKILPSVPLTSLTAIRQSDGRYSIEASFENSIADSLFYRFYVMVESVDASWLPSVLGVVDGRQKDGVITVTVNNSLKTIGSSYLTFAPKSRVFVRFCTMEKSMFDYWNAFENSQNVAMNPVLPAKDNLPAVLDGAKGYWTGYGVYETYIDIPE